MDKERQIKTLKAAFEDVIWMAIRYADGRHTYAPSTVRNAAKEFQKVFPDWKPRNDVTVVEPEKGDVMGLETDYLFDLFK